MERPAHAATMGCKEFTSNGGEALIAGATGVLAYSDTA